MIGATSTPSAPVRVHVFPPCDSLPILSIAAAVLHVEGRSPRVRPPDPRIYRGWLERLRIGSVMPTDAESADVVLGAHDQSLFPGPAFAAARFAMERGKPLLLHSESDDSRPSKLPHGTLLRSSGRRSMLAQHEAIATGCVPDLVAELEGSYPDVCAWQQRPSVSFIGHVAGGVGSLAYLRRGWEHFYGFRLRGKVLDAIESSGAVRTHFVRRRRNLGPPMAGVDEDSLRRQMRREYVQSVFENPYSLCIRGAGNWSYRLFETLAAGRIPILIDTDSVLPLEDAIDWAQHLCRIPIQHLPRAGALIAEFHGHLGPQGLVAMQIRNRRLWLERLEPGAFFEQALRRVAETRSASVP